MCRNILVLKPLSRVFLHVSLCKKPWHENYAGVLIVHKVSISTIYYTYFAKGKREALESLRKFLWDVRF